MIDANENNPYCFGKLHIVFPKGEDGLRHSPESCMMCYCKTECLRKALATKEGLEVEDEKVKRAYQSGTMGFLERWSRKKSLYMKKQKQKKGGDHENH